MVRGRGGAGRGACVAKQLLERPGEWGGGARAAACLGACTVCLAAWLSRRLCDEGEKGTLLRTVKRVNNAVRVVCTRKFEEFYYILQKFQQLAACCVHK